MHCTDLDVGGIAVGSTTPKSSSAGPSDALALQFSAMEDLRETALPKLGARPADYLENPFSELEKLRAMREAMTTASRRR